MQYYECNIPKSVSNIVAGVDEAGRGPLAGPVMAAAVILPENNEIDGLRDSKKLSPKQREVLFGKIKNKAISIGIGQSSVKRIDQMNIRNATFMAMQRALGHLTIKPNSALIDGESLPNQIIPNVGIVRGDDKVDAIKAASIVAKVTRDNLMVRYSKIFPEYGLDKHKGYGTSMHMEALRKYKATPIHRRSFRPVRDNFPTLTWLERKDRIKWLGKKFAALYLMDNGVVIESLNEYLPPYGEIDIIGIENGDWIFAVVRSRINDVRVSNLQLKQFEIEKIKISVEDHLSQYDAPHNYRVDHIEVSFGKKKPIVQHYKGVQFEL